jgi:hypothetical protein
VGFRFSKIRVLAKFACAASIEELNLAETPFLRERRSTFPPEKALNECIGLNSATEIGSYVLERILPFLFAQVGQYKAEAGRSIRPFEPPQQTSVAPSWLRA